MSSEPAILVESVSKRFPPAGSGLRMLARYLLGCSARAEKGFAALDRVSFSVPKGETVGIIGRNGAGKSTLLQIICGTLQPSGGQIKVQGRIAALLELGAGFNPEFTGRENVYLNAAIHGFEREATDKLLPLILAFAEIGEFIDQPVKTYSSGMFVRLAFAVIAHMDADILVIDEALAVGDVYFTQKCMRFLREFAKTRTLLFVSHDTNSVVNLCRHAVWLDEGKIRQQGSARDVCDAYLGSFYEDKLNSSENQPTALAIGEETESFEGCREFGLGDARIVHCELVDESGDPLVVLDRAQNLTLHVTCRARRLVEQPILGFYIKDRLGQPLCGFNTLTQVHDWTELEQGGEYRVSLGFSLPLLATGNYTLSVALAAGTQEAHVQQHWIHDVLAFKASADPFLTGLFTLDAQTCQVTTGQEDVAR